MERELYRHNSKEPRTLIFAGNGSVQRGWDVLKNFIKEKELEIVYQSDPEFFLLQRSESFRSYINQRLDSLSPDKYAGSIPKKWLEKWFKYDIKKDRQDIANAYSDHTLQISEMPDIIEKALANEDTCVITSNWDNALWNWNNQSIKNLCHIHGRCNIPESLIFPTETFLESYAYLREIKKHSLKRAGIHLQEFLEQRVSFLKQAEKKADEWIASSKLSEIIFWGIALHTYDAEIISKAYGLSLRTPEWERDAYLDHGLSLSPITKVIVVNKGDEKKNKTFDRVKSLFLKSTLEKSCQLTFIQAPNPQEQQLFLSLSLLI